MTIIISIFSIIAGFIEKKRKLVFAILLVLIVVLIGWSGNDLADKSSYERIYGQTNSSLNDIYEFMFRKLFYWLNMYDFKFDTWLIIYGIIYAGMVAIITRSISKDATNIPLALTIIFPLAIDAVQQRQTLAMCFGWCAILALIKEEKKKKQLLMFFLFLIIAILFHTSAVLYMFILIAYFFDIRKCTWISIISAIGLSIVGMTLISQISNLLGMVYRVQYIIQASSVGYNIDNVWRVWWRIIVVFLSYAVPYYVMCQHNKNCELQDFIMRANIAALVIMPLILLVTDFYRVQQVLILFNYCAISDSLTHIEQYNDLKKFSIARTNIKSNIMIELITVLFAFFNLYLWMHGTNYLRVFIPFFEENQLLN